VDLLDNPNLLLTSLLVSSVGLVLFLYGKKQARWPQMAVGVVMMVYTYFLSSVAISLGIAAGLALLLWVLLRLGW
jgi:hypothetical protein